MRTRVTRSPNCSSRRTAFWHSSEIPGKPTYSIPAGLAVSSELMSWDTPKLMASERARSHEVEQPQSRSDYLFHRLERPRQNLVGRHLSRIFLEPRLYAPPPCEPNLRVDVHDDHSRPYGLAEVVIVGARPAVQRHEDSRCPRKLRNTVEVQPLLRLAANHALQQAVHVTDCWRQHVDPGRIDELLGLLRRRQGAHAFGLLLEHRGRSADVSDLALDDDARVDRLDGFDRLLRLGHVLVKGQCRSVEDDLVEARPRRLLRLRQ